MTRRPYTQRLRAQQQGATRARILEAAMALHEELGPRATTISSIAARAGVQRLTVYRHFSDEDALFGACTSTWIERHPPPDPARWSAIPEPLARADAALTALGAYYRSTRAMWTGAFRDEAQVPSLRPAMGAFRDYLAGVAGELVRAWPEESRGPSLAATAQHLVAFATWSSLSEAGLDDRAFAALGARWLAASLGPD